MGATAKERHKIVIQASDNDQAKWELALNNAKNLQDDVGATHVDIEIVAYGPGIGAAVSDVHGSLTRRGIPAEAESQASTFCVQLVKPEHVVEEFVGFDEK